MALDLNLMSRLVDEAIEKETPESIAAFLAKYEDFDGEAAEIFIKRMRELKNTLPPRPEREPYKFMTDEQGNPNGLLTQDEKDWYARQPDGSIKSGERYRRLCLHRNHTKELSRKLDHTFSFAGLYPNVHVFHNVQPERVETDADGVVYFVPASAS